MIVMVMDGLTALGKVGVDLSENRVGETQRPENPNQSRVDDSVKYFREVEKDHDGNPSVVNGQPCLIESSQESSLGVVSPSYKPTEMSPFCSCPLNTR